MKRSEAIAFILFGLMVLGSISWATERQGAQVVVTLKSGGKITGELLAVKKDFLVLSADGSGMVRDESIAVQDVREVKVIRRSKAGTSMLIGLLAGAGTGAVIGYSDGNDEPGFFSFTARQKAAIMAVGAGLTGLLVGAIVAGANGADISFRLDNGPKYKVHSALVELSRHARVPELQ